MSEDNKIVRSISSKTAKTNTEFCAATLELKNSIEVSFLELGKRLLNIRDERLFEPNWESFPSYLQEMKMTEATASRLINIYAKFVLEYELAPAKVAEAGGWATLSELLPVIKRGTKEEAVAWLNKASTLTKDDLRKEVKEAMSGIEMAKCKHEETLLFKRCVTCKDTWRVYE